MANAAFPRAAVMTLVDPGAVALGVVDSGQLNMTLADAGEVKLTVMLDDTGILNHVLLLIILDEARQPILDVNGQYILGG